MLDACVEGHAGFFVHDDLDAGIVVPAELAEIIEVRVIGR